MIVLKKNVCYFFYVIRTKCNEYDDGFNDWRTTIEQGKFQAIMFISLIYNLHGSILVWCLTPLAFPLKGFV